MRQAPSPAAGLLTASSPASHVTPEALTNLTLSIQTPRSVSLQGGGSHPLGSKIRAQGFRTPGPGGQLPAFEGRDLQSPQGEGGKTAHLSNREAGHREAGRLRKAPGGQRLGRPQHWTKAPCEGMGSGTQAEHPPSVHTQVTGSFRDHGKHCRAQET